MSMGGWNHGGANVTATVTVPQDWIDPWEAQQIRIWGLERWKQLKATQEKQAKKPQKFDNKSVLDYNRALDS